MKNWVKKNVSLVLLLCVANFCIAQSNVHTVYFSQHSKGENNSVELKSGDKKLIINTIMAYGENVKSLNITMGNGKTFKLAPAQTGQSLNYFGSSMSILLMPNETAVIEFSVSNKATAATRQIFVSGQIIDDSK